MAANNKKSRADVLLQSAVQTLDFKCALKDLSDPQIRYCLDRETRKSAIEALRREARRKGIELETPTVAKCRRCGWSRDQAKDWKAMVCPRCKAIIHLG